MDTFRDAFDKLPAFAESKIAQSFIRVVKSTYFPLRRLYSQNDSITIELALPQAEGVIASVTLYAEYRSDIKDWKITTLKCTTSSVGSELLSIRVTRDFVKTKDININQDFSFEEMMTHITPFIQEVLSEHLDVLKAVTSK